METNRVEAMVSSSLIFLFFVVLIVVRAEGKLYQVECLIFFLAKGRICHRPRKRVLFWMLDLFFFTEGRTCHNLYEILLQGF